MTEPNKPENELSDIARLIRHPLVIVGVIAALAVGFYYSASPYENCMRDTAHDPPTDDVIEFMKLNCMRGTSW